MPKTEAAKSPHSPYFANRRVKLQTWLTLYLVKTRPICISFGNDRWQKWRGNVHPSTSGAWRLPSVGQAVLKCTHSAIIELIIQRRHTYVCAGMHVCTQHSIRLVVIFLYEIMSLFANQCRKDFFAGIDGLQWRALKTTSPYCRQLGVNK